ncbi:hypothetical protein Acr_23g0011040 [Actinidia rufa]|uniref:Uncharacterized protein n=1 Tax=Actinidia rufa TaxID=165716 RepID=A0A7J0GPJ0_9ERIC|nr:hypothetical protein Acr_23g0011040 [Actinidia rufa]
MIGSLEPIGLLDPIMVKLRAAESWTTNTQSMPMVVDGSGDESGTRSCGAGRCMVYGGFVVRGVRRIERELGEEGFCKMGFYQRLLMTSSKSITECNF